MRNKFAEILYKQALKNKKIYLVAADISPEGKLKILREKYPKRFLNVGVAEQVMIGVAAGLAIRKNIVFAYTISTFSLYRPFEMIRDDLCYQNLPVIVVGMGAGSIYSTLGGTHLTQEDISIARSVPNLNVLAPCDPNELEAIVSFLCKKTIGPVYLRIGKAGEKNYTSKSTEKWRFGKIRKIFKGRKSNTCILSYGPIIRKAFEANEKRSNTATIYSVSTLKPFDQSGIKKILKKYNNIITLEDHSEIGGLRDLIKISAYENKFQGELNSFCLKDKFFHKYGTQDDLLSLHGITVSKIVRLIK